MPHQRKLLHPVEACKAAAALVFHFRPSRSLPRTTRIPQCSGSGKKKWTLAQTMHTVCIYHKQIYVYNHTNKWRYTIRLIKQLMIMNMRNNKTHFCPAASRNFLLYLQVVCNLYPTFFSKPSNGCAYPNKEWK